jgi:hypothetical protein
LVCSLKKVVDVVVLLLDGQMEGHRLPFIYSFRNPSALTYDTSTLPKTADLLSIAPVSGFLLVALSSQVGVASGRFHSLFLDWVAQRARDRVHDAWLCKLLLQLHPAPTLQGSDREVPAMAANNPNVRIRRSLELGWLLETSGRCHRPPGMHAAGPGDLRVFCGEKKKK